MARLFDVSLDPWGRLPRVEVSSRDEPGPFLHVNLRDREDTLPETDEWGRPVTTGFETPADVLVYRRAWDDYVLGSLRAFNQCADNFDAVAARPDSAVDPKLLTQYAVAIRKTMTILLERWNQFSGLSAADLMLQSSTILGAYQSVVKAVGDYRASDKFCKDVPKPDPPSFDFQRNLIATLEGASLIGKGVLELLVKSEADGLKVIGEGVASAAAPVLPWIIGGVLAVGAAVWVAHELRAA